MSSSPRISSRIFFPVANRFLGQANSICVSVIFAKGAAVARAGFMCLFPYCPRIYLPPISGCLCLLWFRKVSPPQPCICTRLWCLCWPFFFSMCSFTLFTCQENSLFRTLIATESAHIRNVVTGSMHSQYVIFDVSLLSLILTGLQCKHLRHSPSGHLQSIIMV